MRLGATLYLNGSAEAVAFYTEAFGLVLGYNEKNPDGTYLHAELTKDDKEIFAVSESPRHPIVDGKLRSKRSDWRSPSRHGKPHGFPRLLCIPRTGEHFQKVERHIDRRCGIARCRHMLVHHHRGPAQYGTATLQSIEPDSVIKSAACRLPSGENPAPGQRRRSEANSIAHAPISHSHVDADAEARCGSGMFACSHSNSSSSSARNLVAMWRFSPRT